MRISVTEIENYSCSFEEMSTSNKGSKTTRDKGSPKCVFNVFSKQKILINKQMKKLVRQWGTEILGTLNSGKTGWEEV